MVSKQVAAASAVAVVCGALASGCGRETTCLPEPLAVEPATVSAGAEVTVSSPPAECDLGYGSDTTYEFLLVTDTFAIHQGSVGVARDGSFTTDIPIPADFPPGPTTVLVGGSAFDDCGDEGSCAAYQVGLTVTE